MRFIPSSKTVITVAIILLVLIVLHHFFCPMVCEKWAEVVDDKKA